MSNLNSAYDPTFICTVVCCSCCTPESRDWCHASSGPHEWQVPLYSIGRPKYLLRSCCCPCVSAGEIYELLEPGKCFDMCCMYCVEFSCMTPCLPIFLNDWPTRLRIAEKAHVDETPFQSIWKVLFCGPCARHQTFHEGKRLLTLQLAKQDRERAARDATLAGGAPRQQFMGTEGPASIPPCTDFEADEESDDVRLDSPA